MKVLIETTAQVEVNVICLMCRSSLNAVRNPVTSHVMEVGYCSACAEERRIASYDEGYKKGKADGIVEEDEAWRHNKERHR